LKDFPVSNRIRRQEAFGLSMSGKLLRIQNWEQLAREAKYQPSTMAALCPIALRHLQRFFRQEFGTTPTHWIAELRGRLARDLLAKGWSTKAVAAELHFANDSHFCHEFRKLYPVPPQAYSPAYHQAVPASTIIGGHRADSPGMHSRLQQYE
jgi:transcriptional regulator GlxA family with amidase domain